MSDILKKDGLSIELLTELSYPSQLGIRLKKNLHYFDKESLFAELEKMNEWYDACEVLHDITVDYRIKSIQSARLKYERYYPDHQTGKVFNDLLGFRTLCDNYEEVLELDDCEYIRVADMSKGKAHDDGYRGVHVYFQLDNFHYPIEIQYNTYYDRQLNNWLHKYLYKKNYDLEIGKLLRQYYENARIRSEQEFKEVLNCVLSDCKEF
jgi:putative GTP pyrophosphokinase